MNEQTGMQKKNIMTSASLTWWRYNKATIDYHRQQCILCHQSLRVEQFVVIDAECTFVACI